MGLGMVFLPFCRCSIGRWLADPSLAGDGIDTRHVIPGPRSGARNPETQVVKNEADRGRLC
jgi:hypothetical protein